MSKKRPKDTVPQSITTPPAQGAAQGLPARLVPFQWKPGECTTPKDVVKKRSEAAGLLLMLLQSQDTEGRFVNAQRWFDAVLKSEYLMGKLLDKMMPTLTPEQINLIAGSFESRVLNITGVDAPRAEAPSVEKPTTEEGPFDGHIAKIIEAVDAGAQPATPVVVKPPTAMQKHMQKKAGA